MRNRFPYSSHNFSMHPDNLVFVFFLIFTGAAILGTAALMTRQALILAYILLGVLAGPSGFEWVSDTETIDQIASIGIIFLLFLLGVDLTPKDLIRMLRKTTVVTLLSSIPFATIGFAAGLLTGFGQVESLVIGACLMFSSTILGLKLLPTTVLHHQHMGEVIIAVLLLQDLLAIAILLALEAYGAGQTDMGGIVKVLIGLPVLAGTAFAFGKWVLNRLFLRFDTIHEYIFLVTIGWCLGMAELAGVMGLSHEIGAFIAGITLATSPIAQFITEILNTLRDFFLILFFFSLGARFELAVLQEFWLSSLLLAAIVLAVKPFVFRYLLLRTGERRDLSLQIGVRLGQVSEFSLLVAVMAVNNHVIGDQASYFIQAVTLITFAASSYFIVMRYPTPIGVSDKLRKD